MLKKQIQGFIPEHSNILSNYHNWKMAKNQAEKQGST
jgi:hypothetical protein